MSTASYLLGAVSLLLFVASLTVTAVGMRRRLLPGWAGLEARLAELVLGWSATVVLLQLLGVAGLLRRPALLVGGVLLAGAAVLLRRPAEPEAVAPIPGTPRGLRGLAGTSVALVTAQWLASVRATSRTGFQGVDTLHYHLTYAAHFVRDGSILHLQRLDLTGVATWYPLDDELVHSAGMLLLGTDALSLVLGLASLVAVLLAVWCLAAPYGAAAPALVGTCLLLVVVGPDYAASASNDWSATWPLVAALALLVQARRRGATLPPPVIALTGLAGGLAVGTKLTVLVPALVLLVLVVVLARGQRWRALGLSLGAYLLTGGLWYVRNLVVVGNPLPVAKTGLPRPDLSALDRISFPVLHYATNGHVLRHWFIPSLRSFLGPAWPVLLVLFATGLLLPFVRKSDPLVRGTAVIGLAAAAAYLITPTGAGGLEGQPYLFVYNLRYALVAMLLALLLLSVLLPRVVVTAGLAALLAVTALRASSWATGWPGWALAGVVVLLVLARVARLVGRRVLLGLGCVAVLVLAAPVESRYEAQRYSGDAGPRDVLFAALRGVTGTRVGVVGYPLEYPFFGPRWKNEVVYLGQRGPGQSFADFTDCRAFRQSLRDRHVDWVVVARPLGPSVPAAMAWTHSDPAAQVVRTTSAGTVFHLVGAMHPADCA